VLAAVVSPDTASPSLCSYKATIILNIPELKTVAFSASAAASCATASAPQVVAAAAHLAPDAFEANAAPEAFAAVHDPGIQSLVSAATHSDEKKSNI
jgi:hypothetical protein